MRKLRFRYALLGIAIITPLLYANYGQIMVFSIAKIYRLDISYRDMRNNFFKGLSANDVKIIVNDIGLGVIARKADFKLSSSMELYLKDVKFISKTSGGKKDGTQDMMSVVSMPFGEDIKYDTMYISSKSINNGIKINELSARNNDVRIRARGDILNDNTMDVVIDIFFSTSIVSGLPKELSDTILKNESDGWKSLSISVKGSAMTPSIQITGSLFRLTINN